MPPTASTLHPWFTPRNLLWTSVAVALVTIVLKTLAWYVTGSVGLLSDALESFVNLASAIFALAMVTVAQRPADHNHPYGHHKAEYFSSGFEGILIVGVSLGIFYLARSEKLSWLRIHDYIACCAPFGLFFGRLANFVNGELWGRPTDVPWAIIFPGAPDGLPRHPSQLYEAGLEGLLLGLVLAFFFWRTNARNEPGKLVGIFLLGYGISRFVVEFFREPDVQLGTLSWGLTMGQTLTVPMLVGGAYLIATASKRHAIDAG